VVKVIEPEWPGDPYGPDRELRFYQDFAPRLPVKTPRLVHGSPDPQTGRRWIVLEDLGAGYYYPGAQHTWEMGEVRCFLRSYAHLHISGAGLLPAEGERSWMFTDHRPLGDPEQMLRLAHTLERSGAWGELPGLERLVWDTLQTQQGLSGQAFTLLHHDVSPSNVGLPPGQQGDAILLDWEMAGWGLAEVDLAHLFLQPLRNVYKLGSRSILAEYWGERLALAGAIPPWDVRRDRQRFADALVALSILQAACPPPGSHHPPGSATGAYWGSILEVLYERLLDLCLCFWPPN
jgi:hypothetical protein